MEFIVRSHYVGSSNRLQELADGLIIVRNRNDSFPAHQTSSLADITCSKPVDRCPLARFTSFIIVLVFRFLGKVPKPDAGGALGS